MPHFGNRGDYLRQVTLMAEHYLVSGTIAMILVRIIEAITSAKK
jgi:hypothetical protein